MTRLVRQTSPSALVRTSQPQGAVGIDWSNPITRGLAQVWIPGGAISPSGVAAANYGSPAYGKYGVAGKGNGSSTFALLNGSTRATDAYGSAATTDGAVTFLAAVKVGALASQQHFMNTCDGSGNAMGFRTNTTSIGLSQASGGSILNFTSAVTAGESCIVCVSGRNGSTDFFKNGRFVSNSAVSYGNTIADGVPVIGRSGTSTQYGDHEIYLLLAFNRRLSKSEGESLTANPWQIFKSIARSYPFDLVRGPVQTRESRMLGTSDGAVATVAPAVLGVKSVRTSQPQQAVGIDPIFASRLKVAFLPAGAFIGSAQSTGLTVSATQSGMALVGGSRAEYQKTIDTTKGLTLISVWRSRAGGDYLAADGNRAIASSRTAGNAGWTWGRPANNGAITGGSTGNLTKQSFTIQGVAEYIESNYTIESYVDTPVAVRYNKSTGTISWFAFGKKSSPDTAASTSITTGANFIIGCQGPYGTLNTWLDRAHVVLAFEGVLSDSEIASLTETASSPYRAFTPLNRQIWVAA